MRFGRLKQGRSNAARTACVVAPFRRIRPDRRFERSPGIRSGFRERSREVLTPRTNDRVADGKAAIGPSTGNWDGRWARTWASAGRLDDAVGNSGGGPRLQSAVRIALWFRRNRRQTRRKVRSQRVELVSRIAEAILPATALRRNVHTVRAVRLSRRIFPANQMLVVRPQPCRRWRLRQKTRRARTVRRGLPSSNPTSTPCRMSMPTARQCGHAVSLSRSVNASHSASSRQNHRSPFTPDPRPESSRAYRMPASREKPRGPMNWEEERSGVTQRERPAEPERRGYQIPGVETLVAPDGTSVRIASKMRSECGKGHLALATGHGAERTSTISTLFSHEPKILTLVGAKREQNPA